jgi:hypothetical protein
MSGCTGVFTFATTTAILFGLGLRGEGFETGTTLVGETFFVFTWDAPVDFFGSAIG